VVIHVSRHPTAISHERDRRLRQAQNVAMLIMLLGVALLIYLAVAHTA